MQQKTLFCIQGPATAVQSEKGAARESRTPQYAPSTKATQEVGSEGERDGEGSKAEVTKRRAKECRGEKWHGQEEKE